MEVDIRLDLVHVVGKVDESRDVNSELAENGSNDVHVEDVGLRSLLGQTLDGLRDH